MGDMNDAGKMVDGVPKVAWSPDLGAAVGIAGILQGIGAMGGR